MARKFEKVVNEDVRALKDWKDALENLNTRKSTSGTILTGILSKLEQNLRTKGVLDRYRRLNLDKHVKNPRLRT